MTYDVIGEIYTQAKYDEQGQLLEAPVALEGYHVNVDKVPEELQQYEVFPETPARIFAGGITKYLKFPSKEIWEGYLNPKKEEVTYVE